MPDIKISDAVLVDANLVLWAHHEQFPDHERARDWWAETLTTTRFVGIPWPTVLAFLRISTHQRALEHPLDIGTAWGTVKGWLSRANVSLPLPTDRHSVILGGLLVDARSSGNHVPDAHLAALAIEWGLELQSADSDFARYGGLRWRDPIGK